MSKPNYTPGPWIADALDDENAWVMDEEGNYLFELVTHDSEDRFIDNNEERKANLTLAKAAPQLYEALSGLIKMHAKRGGAKDWILSVDKQTPEMARAIEALIKATHNLRPEDL